MAHGHAIAIYGIIIENYIIHFKLFHSYLLIMHLTCRANAKETFCFKYACDDSALSVKGYNYEDSYLKNGLFIYII